MRARSPHPTLVKILRVSAWCLLAAMFTAIYAYSWTFVV